jgi:uncharacterized protein
LPGRGYLCYIQWNLNEPITFEWDEANEAKLLIEHGVSALEAEQCFRNKPSIRRKGPTFLVLGRTDGGRRLFLVYQRKPGNVIRVYSARNMTAGERRSYRRATG